jgi:hypothetical protein
MKLLMIILSFLMLALASAQMQTTTSDKPQPTGSLSEECDLKPAKCDVCCTLYTRCLSVRRAFHHALSYFTSTD